MKSAILLLVSLSFFVGSLGLETAKTHHEVPKALKLMSKLPELMKLTNKNLKADPIAVSHKSEKGV